LQFSIPKDLKLPTQVRHVRQKVLVVDDDFLIRWSLSQVLSQAGCEVTTAEDGYKAVQKARDQHFDFVITDLSMPVLDGWKLLETLVGFKVPPKVIVMSADGPTDYRAKLKEKGALAYVEKSCLIDKIVEIMEANSSE
jgi:CheY-like chemotaxis protein